ncbi:MAG TPA: hypothetical protein VJ719_07935 [Chthoniobacterales bacterium]|nr:hypothetical protein [Chthoniobacterales bacterium]
MKILMRILVGVIGLVVIILGLKQIYKGVGQMTGKASPAAQKAGEVYTSTENGYSHRVPANWESKPSPQAGVASMFVAPSSSGLASNMVTTVEPYDGSLTDYIAANKQAVSAAAPNAKFLSDAEFATDAKVNAHKVKLQNKMNDIDLAQTMYFFDAPNGRKIIVTCSSPAKFGNDLEPLFDDCMKTFAVK